MLFQAFALLTLGAALILPDRSKHYQIAADSLNALQTDVTYQFFFSHVHPIDPGQYLNIAFPADYADIALAGAKCYVNSVAHTCTKVGLLTARISIQNALIKESRLEIVLEGISNPAAAGTTGYFTIYTETPHTEQPIEKNDAFGLLAFAAPVAAMTGTITTANNKAGALSKWTFKFLTTTALAKSSKFRISLPVGFSASSPIVCSSVSYNGVLSPIQGSFTCSLIRSKLLIEGLGQSLPANSGVAFEVSSVRNPAFTLSASSLSFQIASLEPFNSVLIDEVSIASHLIEANDLTGASLLPYSASSKFSRNNNMHVLLSFNTTNAVDAGGSIHADLQAPVQSCFLQSGLTASLQYIACARSGNTITITGFAQIPAQTQVKIGARIALATADLVGITATTKTAGGSNIDTAALATVTLETYPALQAAAVTYAGNANSAGLVTIQLTPNSNIPPGSVITVTIPAGFTAAGLALATIAGDATPEVVSVSVNSQNLSLTTAVDTITAATGGSIVFTGLGYPSTPSSQDKIYEWVVAVGTTELSTVQSTLAAGALHVAVQYLQEKNVWSRFTFTANTLYGLTNALEIKFPTQDGGTAFLQDLGVGSSISCSSLRTITCTLTPAAAVGPTDFAVLRVDYAASLIPPFTFSVMMKTSSVSAGPTLSLRTLKLGKNVQAVIQTATFLLSFGSSASSWTTKSLSAPSSTTVFSLTELTITLQPTLISTLPSHNLMVVLPAGITFSSVSASLSGTALLNIQTEPNAYAPAIFLSLASATLLPTSSKSLSISGIVNGGYAGSSAGQVDVALYFGGSVVEYGTAGTLPGSTVGLLSLTIAPTGTSKKLVDASYKFKLTTAYFVPKTGQIQLEFPANFGMSFAQCSRSFELTGTVSCSVTGQTVRITGFNDIPAKTQFYVKVWSLVNPNQAASGSFTVSTHFDTTGSRPIESQTDPGFTMTDEVPVGESDVFTISFMPSNIGLVADYLLQFSLDGSVPPTGELSIIFPYALPAALDPTNFRFNQDFSSATLTGSTLKIVPYSDYKAGSLFEIRIMDMTVPAAGTSPISISASWNSFATAAQPATPNSLFSFVPSAAPTAITASVQFYPTNACAVATYKFTVGTTVATNEKLFIKMPNEFPGYLGDLNALSAGSSRGDQQLNMQVSEDRRHFTLTGFNTQTGSFIVTITGVHNPSAAGLTGTIYIGKMNAADSVIAASNSNAVTITAKPASLHIKSISLGNSLIRATTYYSLLLSPPAFSAPKELWLAFPEAALELPGLGASFPCATYTVDRSTGAESSFGAVACTNGSEGVVAASFTFGAFDGSKDLRVVVNNVKSINVAGTTRPFVVSLYDSASKALVAMSFAARNNIDQVDLQKGQQELFFDNANGALQQGIGIIKKYTLYASSVYTPVKNDLSFTCTVESRAAAGSVIVEPFTFAKGSLSTNFYVKTLSTASEGVYTLKWAMQGTSAGVYLEPLYSQLYVDPLQKYPIHFEPVPSLFPNKTSIALIAWLDVAPVASLKLTLKAAAGISSTPIAFGPGITYQTYYLTIAASVAKGSYSIAVTAEGEGASNFEAGSFNVNIITSDITRPGIALVEVKLPKERLALSLIFQATESCMLLYTFGVRGLAVPEFQDLLMSALNFTQGYYIQLLDGDFQQEFRISGLRAEYDYVLYGLLMDLSGIPIQNVFTLNLYTADMYDSVYFTLMFNEPVPTADKMPTVLSTLAEYFVLMDVYQIQYSGDGALKLFTIYNDPWSPLPPPVDMVRYLAVPADINAVLAPINAPINQDYYIQSSIGVVDNRRPEWASFPVIQSSLKDSLNITMKVTTSGFVYVEILSEGEQLPSSRQVTLGYDAFNRNATRLYKEKVTALETLDLSYKGLLPATSYTLVITAINDDVRMARYMDDNMMAKMDIIIQAEGVAVISIEAGQLLLGLLGILLLT